MFSKLTLAAVNTYFRLMRKINCIPFNWDEKEQRLSVNFSTKTKFVLGSYYVWTFLYNLSIIESLHYQMQRESVDVMSVTLDILFMLHFVCQPIMSISCVLNRKSHALFLSTIFEMNRDLTFQFKTEEHQKRDGAEPIWTFVNSILNVPIMGTTFFVLKSSSKRYLYNRIPDYLQIKPVFAWFCFMEYMSHVINISILTFYFTETFIYPRMINFWSKKISQAVELRKDHESLLQIVAKMQVLDKIANECLSSVFCPLVVITIVITGTIGLYGSIVLYHQLSVLEYATFPAIAILILTGNFESLGPAGFMKSNTENMLRIYAREAPSKYWREKVRAMRPLQLKAAFAFPFTETTSIAVLSIIFSSTINLVILHAQ